MGATQGLTEWLPISSQGIILFVSSFFNSDNKTLEEIFAFSLTLHLGTSFSAIYTYRKKILFLIRGILQNNRSKDESIFYLATTIISLVISLPIYLLIPLLSSNIELLGVVGMMFIGFVYLINGLIQFIGSGINKRTSKANYSFYNAFIVGLFQGLSIIPGMSRSGMTISALLIRKFDKNEALNISFILSIPVTIIAGIMGIYLLLDDIFINLISVLVAFIIGIITIRYFIIITQSIAFYNFVFFIGFLLISGGVLYLVFI
ncbi:MAG: undecaprenyl-diphosphate phosphatase [Dehalococcoidia bacterium]